jgi:hypothetical protein
LRALVGQFSQERTGISFGVDGLEKIVGNWQSFLERIALMNEPADALEKLREYTPQAEAA